MALIHGLFKNPSTKSCCRNEVVVDRFRALYFVTVSSQSGLSVAASGSILKMEM